jgi:hypothetical protein
MRSAVSEAPARATQRCVCGLSYSPRAWSELERLETLAADALGRHILGWPEGAVIEVRACRACGRRMARRPSAIPG